MCTEFFLAIIYFLTIFIVNIFFSKLLKIYIKNFFSYLKLKKILQTFKKLEEDMLINLYSCLKKEKINLNLLKFINYSLKKADILIVENTYKYMNNSLANENNNSNQNYYSKLLRKQAILISKD